MILCRISARVGVEPVTRSYGGHSLEFGKTKLTRTRTVLNLASAGPTVRGFGRFQDEFLGPMSKI